MNKKFLAMLMALVMVFSLVPVAAMAAEECEHENVIYVPTEPGYHDMMCTDCGYMYGFNFTCKGADGDYDGTCDKCGYQYKKPAHTCTMDEVVSISDTQHQFKCNGCGKLTSVPMNHNDGNGDGKCDSCGYQKYTAPEEEHEHNYVAHSNNDGTHLLTCSCGGEVTMNCADNDGDGKCDSCGYQKYTAPEEEHEHNYVAHSNNDGTHLLTCKCGGEVTVKCMDNDGDGKCDSCGYQKYVAPEEDHEHNYVAHSNNDGTHLLTCNCGGEVTVKCLDNDGDGKCDSCGYQKYAVACEHEFKGAVDNKDGLSHNIVCRDCTKTLTVKVAHEYVDGICVCGAVAAAEEPETEEPEEPKEPENNEGMDDVPKTGESIILVTFVAMMVIGLVGIVVYFLPRKKHI